MADWNEATLEVWKVTIDVQKHFNDLSLRVRSIAVTVLGAFLAGAGYALKEQAKVMVIGAKVSLPGLILLAGFVCWSAFYVMDRLWYHRLLRAAVIHGRKVEAELEPAIPAIGLTGTIDDLSPLVGLRAGHRLSIFYAFIAALLLFAAGVAFEAGTGFYLIATGTLLVPIAIEFWPRTRFKRGIASSKEE